MFATRWISLACVAMLAGCASPQPVDDTTGTGSTSSALGTTSSATLTSATPSPSQYQRPTLAGCAPYAAGRQALDHLSVSQQLDHDEARGVEVDEEEQGESRTLRFTVFGGSSDGPGPGRYMEVADQGVTARQAGTNVTIEAHIELHSTDAFMSEPSRPAVEVVTDYYLPVGNFTIDVCLQTTGGIQRTVTGTSHLFANFTYP